MGFEKKIAISNASIREETVKNFIKTHAGCCISDVVRDAEYNEYGSKRTIENIIKSLIEKGIIEDKKKKRNSRDSVLTIKENDPSVIIPEQFRELKKLFKIFTTDLVNIYSKPDNEWPNLKHLPDMKWNMFNVILSPSGLPVLTPNPLFTTVPPNPYRKARLTIYRAIQIPFVIIDIINASIKFLQLTAWIKYEKKKYELLNDIIFNELNNFNQIAFEVVRLLVRDPYKYPSHYENDDYFITVENRYGKYSTLEKICLIRHRCKSIGLSNEIDSLLNYLIENNMNYFVGLNKMISPDFKWPNNEIPNKNKLDLIHDLECPGKKSENEMACERLDKDPIFTDF